jgi:hypothetical protein
MSTPTSIRSTRWHKHTTADNKKHGVVAILHTKPPEVDTYKGSYVHQYFVEDDDKKAVIQAVFRKGNDLSGIEMLRMFCRMPSNKGFSGTATHFHHRLTAVFPHDMKALQKRRAERGVKDSKVLGNFDMDKLVGKGC